MNMMWNHPRIQRAESDICYRAFDNIRFVLCHYPLLEWDGAFRGAIHLHGHSHNNWPQTKYRRLDVGVDGHNMEPWSLDEILAWSQDRPFFDQEIYAI